MTDRKSMLPGTARELKDTDVFSWFTRLAERRRAFADSLDTLSQSLDYQAELTKTVIGWLKGDLFQTIEDEAHDLFPTLRSRAQKRDDFEGALAKLGEAHLMEQNLARRIVPKLEVLSGLGHPATTDRALSEMMTDLADKLRNHSAILSAIVLPIARLRLKAGDLSALSRSIRLRRTI